MGLLSLLSSVSLAPPFLYSLSHAPKVPAILGWEPKLLFCHLRWHLPGEKSRDPAYQGRESCQGLAERLLSFHSKSKRKELRVWGKGKSHAPHHQSPRDLYNPLHYRMMKSKSWFFRLRGHLPVARVRGGLWIRNRKLSQHP